MVSRTVAKKVRADRSFLYVEPVSACNLNCRLCYANTISGPARRLIPAETMLDFAGRFVAMSPSPVEILWCGTGEIFLHPGFPEVLNRLLGDHGEGALSVHVQTNGENRRLRELRSPGRVNLRVSIDGPRRYHDWNRGKGSYDRVLEFCREAVELGCRSLIVRMLLMQGNIHALDEFSDDLRERVGTDVPIWPVVPYTNRDLARARREAPSIRQRDIDDAGALTREEAVRVLAGRYQGRYALDEDAAGVSTYLSLNTYGVFSCCNGIVRLGDAADDVGELLARLSAAQGRCRSCGMFPC